MDEMMKKRELPQLWVWGYYNKKLDKIWYVIGVTAIGDPAILYSFSWILGHFKKTFIDITQEFVRKDRQKELLYYVNLIRAC